MKTSLLSSLLTICGTGWAIVDRNVTTSASESQIPGGSLVMAASVPSNPYEGSKIAIIFRPTLRSIIWNTDGGGGPAFDIAFQFNLY
jgi:hypothetical protein